MTLDRATLEWCAERCHAEGLNTESTKLGRVAKDTAYELRDRFRDEANRIPPAADSRDSREADASYLRDMAANARKANHWHVAELTAHANRLDQIAAAIAHAGRDAADAARLDWISEHWFYRSGYERVIQFAFNEIWDGGDHKTLREAIDAAIAAAKTEGAR